MSRSLASATTFEALEERVDALEGPIDLSALQSQIVTLQGQVAALQAALPAGVLTGTATLVTAGS